MFPKQTKSIFVITNLQKPPPKGFLVGKALFAIKQIEVFCFGEVFVFVL